MLEKLWRMPVTLLKINFAWPNDDEFSFCHFNQQHNIPFEQIFYISNIAAENVLSVCVRKGDTKYVSQNHLFNLANR